MPGEFWIRGMAALGGVFLALYAANLKKFSLLPVNDPGLAKALVHHVH